MYGEVCKRPNGRFFDGHFSWLQPYGLADYEEEWGWKWIDGIDLEFARRTPFYDKTGRIRPFEDMKELYSRRLKVAQARADNTWNLVGSKVGRLVFDEALNSSESVSVDIKELAELLYSLDEEL